MEHYPTQAEGAEQCLPSSITVNNLTNELLFGNDKSRPSKVKDESGPIRSKGNRR
jgi:hypothetical protein